jgi:hypothetical protein
MKPYILPLSDSHSDLDTVKGMSLSRLVMGIPVPDGSHDDRSSSSVCSSLTQTKIPALNDANIYNPTLWKLPPQRLPILPNQNPI